MFFRRSKDTSKKEEISAKDLQGCFPTIRPVLARPGFEAPAYKIYAIHGLSSSTDTWTADRDHYRWLESLPGWLEANGGRAADIGLVGWNTQYNSAANISTQIRSDVRQLANAIIRQYGERQDIRPSRYGPVRPQRIIFIGHSMGGILVRALLGWMYAEGTYKDFLSRVDGVILLASPSDGAGLANLLHPVLNVRQTVCPGMRMLINSSHARDLRPGSKELHEIGASFAIYCRSRAESRNPLVLSCLIETARVKNVLLVVNPESADIPREIRGYVDGMTEQLQGLNHVQVTNYTRQQAFDNDENLRKIIKHFLRSQGVRRGIGQIELRPIL